MYLGGMSSNVPINICLDISKDTNLFPQCAGDTDGKDSLCPWGIQNVSGEEEQWPHNCDQCYDRHRTGL